VVRISAYFLGGCRGTYTPKHFVNLTEESKNFKMLEFPLNQLQTFYGRLCDLCPLTAFIFSDLNYIFLSQTESTFALPLWLGLYKVFFSVQNDV
jgi:hypothetical protein